ncbi:MAG: carbohydrate kinase family protein [Planctomycetota bacterium]|jgi:ribokinase
MDPAALDIFGLGQCALDSQMDPAALDIFGLGQCALDHVVSIDHYPAPDSKCEFGELVIQGGGPVATATVALTRWGLSCSFTGVIGDDAFGERIRASLEEENVPTDRLVVREGATSQVAFITAEPATVRRTIFWRRPTGAPLGPEEVDLDGVKRARILYTDGLYAEAALAACRVAKQHGTEVVVDAGSLREGILDIARLSDHFIVSATFARSYAGSEDPWETCRRLRELGPMVVGVTLGPKGCVALAGDDACTVPAHSVDARDTTGCGDVFHAGYAYGLLKGWPVDQRLDFGAWAAAEVARHLGGRRGIPSASDYPGMTRE